MLADSFDSVRLPNQSLRIMAKVLEEHGLAVAPLMAEAGIEGSVLDDPWATVTGQQELDFQTLFVKTTRHIPGIGLVTGQRYRLMAYGPIGLAAMVSATVIDGLRLFSRLQALGFSMMNYQIVERDGMATGYAADDTYAPASIREFMHERALTSVTTFFNDMRQQRMPLDRIESVLQRPRNWMDVETLLGTEVIFGAPRTTFHFAEGAEAQPLPMANPLLEESYLKLCLNLLETSPNPDEFVRSVYHVLMQSRMGFPSAREVASELSISERTLHRHLKARGTSFGTIIDNVRLRRARELLENTSRSIEAIGERLGFAETASFCRFFKRVAGVSPSDHRRTSCRIMAHLIPGAKGPGMKREGVLAAPSPAADFNPG